MTRRDDVVLQARPRGKAPAWWPRVANRSRWASVAPDGVGWLVGLHTPYAVSREDVDELREQFRLENDGCRWSFKIVPL